MHQTHRELACRGGMKSRSSSKLAKELSKITKTGQLSVKAKRRTSLRLRVGRETLL